MKKLVMLVLALVVACAPMSFADVCDGNVPTDYLKGVGTKLSRGGVNILTGWAEVIRQPIILENKWEGLSKGLYYAVARTGSGALDVISALFPTVETPQQTPVCLIEA